MAALSANASHEDPNEFFHEPTDSDGDGVIDYFDQDDDGDGIPDWDDPELNKQKGSLPAPGVLAVISMLGAATIFMPRKND